LDPMGYGPLPASAPGESTKGCNRLKRTTRTAVHAVIPGSEINQFSGRVAGYVSRIFHLSDFFRGASEYEGSQGG
ncbi:MAG: hypothetical protein MK479_10210, partial [Planctomycetes bacterium]|nr:hypothetical protein [Planctomycetota bacterium]